MTSAEAKAKREDRFWVAYDDARQASMAPAAPSFIRDCAKDRLVRVMDAIARDGFRVQVVEHVSDRMLRGLVFHEITQCDPIKHEKSNG